MRFIFINASLCIKYVIAEIHPGKNKIAADKKSIKYSAMDGLTFSKATAVPYHIGIIATLYIGGLTLLQLSVWI